MTKLSFYSTAFSILLGLLSNRIINQTDILMVSTLGENFLSASVFTNNLMIIDSLIAFTIAPIISIQVTFLKIQELKDKIPKWLSFTLIIGIFLTIICYFVYPHIANYVIQNNEIKYIADRSIFYMTLCITPRLFCLVSSMMLYSLGQGINVILTNVICVLLNAIGNFLFMILLKLGYDGIYYSTLLISFINMFLFMSIFYFKGYNILKFFDINDVSIIIHQSKYEIPRQLLERVSIIIMIEMISENAHISSAYALATSYVFLISVLFIPLLRSLSIYFSKKPLGIRQIIKGFKIDCAFGIFFLTILTCFFISYRYEIGSTYNLTSQSNIWWSSFVIIFSISMILRLMDTFLRSIFISRNKNQYLLLSDLISTVLMLLICKIGFLLDNPFVFWSSMITFPLVCVLVLMLNIKKVQLSLV
ncbi:MAG: hypothetical protein J0H93_08480 [Chlamydiales bacterium]|nr:hypothetical protein [Chlamydiales bacterium]